MNTYSWADSSQRAVRVDGPGPTMFVPADPLNTDYAKLVESGIPIAPYVPPAPQAPRLPFLEFMALFTPTEQATIVTSPDTQLKIWLLMATGTGEIGLGDPKTISGVAYLVTLGLITAARQTQILAGTTPA